MSSRISSPVGDTSDHTKLLKYFEDNKDNPWSEWLTFRETFPKPGKQGLVGLMDAKNIPGEYIFKVPQNIDYLAKHEGGVMRGINEISAFCPHFCRIFGTITCDVDARHRKTGNPFKNICKYPITKEVLICEHINDSCKLSTYLRSRKANETVAYSQIKQVLMAIIIAQRHKKLTHNDLHSSNIMLKKCNRDVVFLYVLDDGNQFAIPTNGYYPVIIDFGFSYIENMDDGPLWMSMAHTDVGFMSDRFDWVADPKLFLVTVSDELKQEQKTKTSLKLRRIVRNIFGNLKIDWESGWDDVDERSAADHVSRMLEDYNQSSSLFEKFEHYCIDILQSLIITPLEPQSYSSIGISYQAFLQEWCKIENEISDEFFNLHVLKGLVDAARHVRAAYHSKSTRAAAITDFSNMVYERINTVGRFCRPKKVDFEKLLCSLLVLAKCIEGVLYDMTDLRMRDKLAEYEKLPVNSTEQIYGVIDTNIEDKYIYNENTSVSIFDCVRKESRMMSITKEQADFINGVHHLCRGSALYQIYNGTSLIRSDLHVGSSAIYKNSETVKILRTHTDDQEPYYTVLTQDGQERQTTAEHLVSCHKT
jgi:hypothetical protein